MYIKLGKMGLGYMQPGKFNDLVEGIILPATEFPSGQTVNDRFAGAPIKNHPGGYAVPASVLYGTLKFLHPEIYEWFRSTVAYLPGTLETFIIKVDEATPLQEVATAA